MLADIRGASQAAGPQRDDVHEVDQPKRRDPEVFVVGGRPADLLADIKATEHGAGPHTHRLANMGGAA